MRQRFVPELQSLRVGPPYTVAAITFPASNTSTSTSTSTSSTGTSTSTSKALRILPVTGAQVEIEAALSFPPGSKSVFGLMVFVGAKGAGGGYEHTDIVFDLSLNQVQVDRRGSSSNGTDNDVRAGPMPASLGTAGTVRFHAYIDHSIVTVIVENQTALTTWVHPVSADSTGIALFNSGPGPAPTVVEMTVWQLANITQPR